MACVTEHRLQGSPVMLHVELSARADGSVQREGFSVDRSELALTAPPLVS